MAGKPQHLKENDAIIARTIGKRLNILRSNRDVTLEEVSRKVLVSHQELSAYERGTRKPSLSVLISLSTYYGTTVDYILGLEPWENGLYRDDPREHMTNFVKAG